MRREIKFRAWDEQNKEMHYPKDATENFGHGAIDSAHLLKHYSIVMQYTGLKDRGGKEIYEGDILGIPYIPPFGKFDETDISHNSEVRYQNGAFVVKMHPEDPQYSLINNWCKRGETRYVPNVGEVTELLDDTFISVLGNIYETPELLK